MGPVSSPANFMWFIIVSSVPTYIPIHDISIKYTIIPNIILTVAPAATIAILFGILAFEKDPDSSDLSSSPSILQNPPNGIARMAYFVSFP